METTIHRDDDTRCGLVGGRNRELNKLQYQALRKATRAVRGASKEKVNKIAWVEDARTVLDASQQRCMGDPTTTQDIFDTIDTEPGRHWTDNMGSWVQEEERMATPRLLVEC